MCQDHDGGAGPDVAAVLHRPVASGPGAPTRRGLLGGAAALGLGVLLRPRAALAGSAVRPAFGSAPPVRVATHVHASYSEQTASWDLQYSRAAEAGVDVLVQTDHDHQMLVQHHLHRGLAGTWVGSTSGARPQGSWSADVAGDGLRLAVESSTAQPCTAELAISELTARNMLRTGVSGQTVVLELGAVELPAGASFEVLVGLSDHPATSGRAAGRYALLYRFTGSGPGGAVRLDGSGRTATITAPAPVPGATLRLVPVQDIALAWGDLLASDNGTTDLRFRVTSPSAGRRAAVDVTAVSIERTRSDPQSLLADNQAIAARCSATHGVRGVLGVEVSTPLNAVPHVNTLFAPFAPSDKAGVGPDTWLDVYRPIIAAARQAGGAVSWNHAFGPGGGSLTAEQQLALRRSTFRARLADRFAGATLLEIYLLRQGMPAGAFLDLADTFARHGIPLTYTGAHDDHSGPDWRTLHNPLVTGVHSDGDSSDAALARALNAGRAFGASLRWAGSHLDTLVDGVPMGGMTVSRATRRTVAVDVAGLPPDARVEIVAGPVDATGVDPGTRVVGGFTASTAAARTGVTEVTVDTPSRGAFVRPQVRSASGALLGWGQPTWFLAEEPAGGLPEDRAY